MKVWKLVSGILSIIFAAIVLFQSCAVGVSNVLESNTTDTSGSSGVLVTIMMLAGGIVSIATRKSGKGGSIATAILFLFGALFGFMTTGKYAEGDLRLWAGWCLICGIIALISIFTAKKKNA